MGAARGDDRVGACRAARARTSPASPGASPPARRLPPARRPRPLSLSCTRQCESDARRRAPDSHRSAALAAVQRRAARGAGADGARTFPASPGASCRPAVFPRLAGRVQSSPRPVTRMSRISARAVRLPAEQAWGAVPELPRCVSPMALAEPAVRLSTQRAPRLLPSGCFRCPGAGDLAATVAVTVNRDGRSRPQLGPSRRDGPRPAASARWGRRPSGGPPPTSSGGLDLSLNLNHRGGG